MAAAELRRTGLGKAQFDDARVNSTPPRIPHDHRSKAMSKHLSAMSVRSKWGLCPSSFLRVGVQFFLLLFTAAINTPAQTTAMKIDLEQAIQMALAHNHALKAARTQIQQSQAEEITAAIRPNPVFTYDDLYVPIFSPSQFTENTLNTVTEFDAAVGWTFERGGFRG